MKTHTARLFRVAGLVAIASAMSNAALGNTIFTNFGTGPVYDNSNGAVVGSGFDGSYLAQGASFTAGSSGVFGSLEIALSLVNQDPLTTADLVIALAGDSSSLPSSALESWHVSWGGLQSLGSSNAPLLLTSALSLNLTAGTAYWVTASLNGAAFSDAVAWNWNSTGSTNLAGYNDGSGWYAPTDPGLSLTSGAFQVNELVATTVPEPATIALFAFGLAGLGYARRKA